MEFDDGLEVHLWSDLEGLDPLRLSQPRSKSVASAAVASMRMNLHPLLPDYEYTPSIIGLQVPNLNSSIRLLLQPDQITRPSDLYVSQEGIKIKI